MDRFQFLLILSVVCGGLVEALKTGKLQAAAVFVFKAEIPKRALPWISLFLGVCGTLIEAGLRGEAFTFAAVASVVLQGLFSGGFAVAGAETLAKLKTDRRVDGALILLILFGSGCTGGAGQWERFVDTTVDAVPVLDTQMHKTYERELKACTDVACVDEREAEWSPSFDLMGKIREAWCFAAPENAECQKGGK